MDALARKAAMMCSEQLHKDISAVSTYFKYCAVYKKRFKKWYPAFWNKVNVSENFFIHFSVINNNEEAPFRNHISGETLEPYDQYKNENAMFLILQ